jgi:xylan 1,4-beta-xylosidase
MLGAALVSLALAPVPTVAADFSRPVERPSMVGFVHGMDMDDPPDERIEPLDPQLWRGKVRDVPYSRVRELGGTYTYILSDRWGYPGDGVRPPYEDWRGWERMVRQVARAARGKSNGLIDVWNEPNDPHFWRGTKEQFFETYRRAWVVLRRVLGPEVPVAGPSTLGWRRDWAEGLLEWCRVFGCEVNVLAWHELSGDSIPAIADRIEEAREQLVESPRWAAQAIREIHVNEAVVARDQYRPGELLGYFHYLEAGGAHAAARACWNDLSGESNCYNDSLAGLLVPGTHEPRSAWWATKAYADGAGARVRTRFGDPHVVAMASRRSARANTAQLLIGHLRGSGRRSVDVTVKLRGLRRMRFMRGAKRVRVGIQRLPDSGEAPLRAPWRRRGTVRPIRDRVARLTLHDVRLHEAYVLTLSRP